MDPDSSSSLKRQQEAPVTAHVTVAVTDGTVVITLNKPEARNALDRSMAEAIATALDELDERNDLRIGILTGAGSAFCAGMDLKAFARGERPSIPGRGLAGLTERPPKKPLIAAVEGYALAGGFEIALGCDIIVAAENAQFGLPEVKRGLVAAGGGLLRLPKVLPYGAAMELALTGGFLSGQRAYELGLVARLAQPGQALAVATTLASEIAGNAPLALMATKAILAGTVEWTDAEAFVWQRSISEPVFTSEDAQEGARAFAEKRRPQWQAK